MRTLAIGDIHGCFQSLCTLEKAVPFQPDDQLIFLGDYVNRGPASFAVLDWLIARSQQRKVITLRGNHEIMMLKARGSPDAFNEWIRCGGDATLASYALHKNTSLKNVPDSHWAFLEERTQRWYETDSHIFVHANLYTDMLLEEQPDFMLFWERFDNPAPHESGKVMVCGHTSQKSGKPLDIGHAVCIDT